MLLPPPLLDGDGGETYHDDEGELLEGGEGGEFDEGESVDRDNHAERVMQAGPQPVIKKREADSLI